MPATALAQPMKSPRLTKNTTQQITHFYQALDYKALGPIYCDEGGDEFWEDRRGPCQKMGTAIAKALRARLPPLGRSLYVGAGVPEIPVLLMERLELNRTVYPYNLRQGEVDILNQAGGKNGIRFSCDSAESATDTFDHLWIVSVLNDPEEFPNLAVLFSYGRADPFAFDTKAFSHEREAGIRLFENCMAKLTTPGWLTTSVEEIPWVEHWCETHQRSYQIAPKTYPTALVGDPVCFIQIQ